MKKARQNLTAAEATGNAAEIERARKEHFDLWSWHMWKARLTEARQGGRPVPDHATWIAEMRSIWNRPATPEELAGVWS